MNRTIKRCRDNWTKSGEGEGAHCGDKADAPDATDADATLATLDGTDGQPTDDGAMGQPTDQPLIDNSDNGSCEGSCEGTNEEDNEDDDESMTEIPERYLPIPTLDLSEKGKYVNQGEPHVLYAWHMWDHFQIMKVSIQRLSSTVATGHGLVPTLVPQITFRNNARSVGVAGLDSVGEASTVANFAIAESVSIMANNQRYVRDLEAADREKKRQDLAEQHAQEIAYREQQRRDLAEQHAKEIACRRREQNVTMCSQTTASIDKLQTEKRQLRRELTRFEIQLLQYNSETKEHDSKDIKSAAEENQNKKTKLSIQKIELEVKMIKNLIEDVEVDSAQKQQLVQSLLVHEHDQDMDIVTPKRANKTPDSVAASPCDLEGDFLNGIQKNLMGTSQDYNVDE